MSLVKILKDRAAMFAAARQFFSDRKIIEVDCPIASPRASVDTHIDLISVHPSYGPQRYLHSSPEYGMKRLLAEGIGDIYQISHVFRDGEQGKQHNPEFTLVEWYRQISFTEMIEETIDFIRLFIGEKESTHITYREAFKKHVGIDYHQASIQDLQHFLQKIPTYQDIEKEGKDALLNVIIAEFIEPQLGQDQITALTHYPASQAALAKQTLIGDEPVAERFEIYFQGVELANGYYELADPIEQRQRFDEANALRIAMGKKPLPKDEFFLKALEKGLPDCCGVAVGFDRLMMLRHDVDTISLVIPFDWDNS